MTPERAAELAGIYAADYIDSQIALRDLFQKAILAACKEQREEDARICDKYAKGGIDGWKNNTPADCAKAIRREK